MERIDVYDISGEKVIRSAGRDEPLGKDERILVVHICVFNSCGEMLIQQRQLTKDRYPGCWDVSAGGFVKSGESSADAVMRELSEELGIVCRPADIRFVLREPFSYVYDDFYILFSDVRPDELVLQSREVMAVRWAGRAEVTEMLSSGQFVDYDGKLMESLFDEGTK